MADIAMTGEAGANRTFRSIFGDQRQQPEDVLKLEHSDGSASVAGGLGAGAAVLAMDDDDDDDAMWSDEVPLDGDATAKDNNDMPGLQFAQRKSMEEWADDDDEEENWKEALQDRVNQLELAFQHNDDSTAADSRRRFEQQQQQLQQSSASEPQRADFSRSLPVPSCLTAPNIDSERSRHANRHKMQRTSSSHACINGEKANTSSRPNHLWNFQRKVVGGTSAIPTVQDSRSRSHSIDFVARNIQTVEHHRNRSGLLSGSTHKTESPRHSLSRKNSMDTSRSSLSRSNSSSLRANKIVAPTSSGEVAVFNLSDTEAIRRFVLDDVKTMSMERLVGDAQRLHLLEDFYQNHQGSGPALSVTTVSTASVAPPSPASSTSPMSTS
ncbi:uncharacterized protein PITG_08686 [Phytophthora infestans T30-4]|uniref:Uncharacterized protein n=2 Tax=Phytophthora infestans TaxID=4787 RepID=D0NCY3_PHYIT|nr:uncharacterized protein PITG_08686 [Phytophthora infestans T30-4]EEY55940.1 conserved hypothetical protein [Phytophthora infestans T30-4]KAF4036799.1 hypothetical protein GN244_ATG11136 [Phytophthora infestans]KAF4135464.1 hypothetical protein GN958_ATG15346 [Phytophthora infestans]|eukprot:XP_002902770.1 conserved hypothetical protein [Phytophthora infestans T30-4]